ncbi:MAG: radical SAM protein [Desulfomonilia bacterium]|nr:radical SAM protein [Desulfomonilia bacterium]
MGDIALIYPFSQQNSRTTMLFHPLGIAQISSMLRRDGLDVTVVDLTFEDEPDVFVELERLNPRIIGVYVMLTMYERARTIARRIREILPDTVLACGGPMPTLDPDRFSSDFDYVFRGEAVDSFPRFCRDYLNGKNREDMLLHSQDYPGFYHRDLRTGTLTSVAPESSDERRLNLLPLPDRSDYNHARYQLFWIEREGFSPAGIMTTFGCPYTCDFCSKPIFGNYFRRRHMDNLVHEIHDIKSWGYDGLWIADDCFTLDLDHVRSFCTRMIRENLEMEWTCLSRTEGVPVDITHLMKQAGCKKVFFGLESGDNSVLKLMNKNTTVESAEKTLTQFSQCGIETAGFFMVGYPGESYETIEQTFAWALKLPLDELSFTTPFPLPGTGLYRKVRGLQKDADWRFENENRFTYRSEFDEEYLHRRIEETYERFSKRKNHHPRL